MSPDGWALSGGPRPAVGLAGSGREREPGAGEVSAGGWGAVGLMAARRSRPDPRGSVTVLWGWGG